MATRLSFSHATCLDQLWGCNMRPHLRALVAVFLRARHRIVGYQFTFEAPPEILASSDSPTCIKPRQVTGDPQGRPSLPVLSSTWREKK